MVSKMKEFLMAYREKKYTLHLGRQVVTNRMNYGLPTQDIPKQLDSDIREKVIYKYHLNPLTDEWLIERFIKRLLAAEGNHSTP